MSADPWQFTPHFNLREFIRSDTARRENIDNTPDADQIEALKSLCINVLEPLRVSIGNPVIITSGYRCAALNKAVGGVPDSAHTRGEAADIIVTGMTDDQLAVRINALGLEFDQLISEGSWTHISYCEGGNRGQYLTATFEHGKAHYTLHSELKA